MQLFLQNSGVILVFYGKIDYIIECTLNKKGDLK